MVRYVYDVDVDVDGMGVDDRSAGDIYWDNL